VSRAFLGVAPAFAPPLVTTTSLWEVILSPGLGLLAALAAWLLVRLLSLVEHGAASSRAPLWLRPALGGVAVGLVGYLIPQTLGFSFAPVVQILQGDIGFTMLLALLLGKVLSTSLTLGQGERRYLRPGDRHWRSARCGLWPGAAFRYSVSLQHIVGARGDGSADRRHGARPRDSSAAHL